MCIALASCGGSTSDEVSISASKGPTASEAVSSTERPYQALAQQVAAIPILSELSLAPSADLGALLERADGIVVGTIADVELGPETSVSKIPVTCERDEGVSMDGECHSELRSVTLVVTIEPDSEAWAAAPSSAEALRVQLPFATLPVPLESSRAEARARAEAFMAAVAGAEVVALLARGAEGSVTLAGSSALAGVGPDGNLWPAPFGPEDVTKGIGEARSVEGLLVRAEAALGPLR
jgi:hypothetical protein